MKAKSWLPFRAAVLMAICFSAAQGRAAFADDGPLTAQSINPQNRGSGLPLPRFASLKADEVNVRTGPGPRYPIEWILKRKGMPKSRAAAISNSGKAGSRKGGRNSSRSRRKK